MPTTRDGYLWTAAGEKRGLETDAVLDSTASIQSEYDVIVIGAGWAGLIAARDLSQLTSSKVILLEARDRIGGRTWTAKERGQEFEMGGGWITWNQPHLWTELQRYGMDKHIIASDGTTKAEKTYYRPASRITEQIQGNENQYATFDAIFEAFFSIDGHTSRSLMPFPHDPFRDPAPWKQYDFLSVKDRIEQLRALGMFSDADLDMFESLTNGSGLTHADKRGFSEFLFWWALGGHSMAGIAEANGVWKIGNGGMTEFAKRAFKDFGGDVAFGAEVVGIREGERRRGVEVVLKDGRVIVGRDVVSTIPLNCLSAIHFDPPLSPLRQEAMQQGHVNLGSKIHFELARFPNPWLSLTSPQSDSAFPTTFSDHSSTSTTYAVAFGYAESALHLDDPAAVQTQFRNLFPASERPEEITAYVTHDWKNDAFARGSWVACAPGYMLKYQQELQKDHGNVVFVSADWVDGWRGFVDGAIAAGRLAARKIGDR